MITREEINEILAVYKKHGWKPSRVLCSTALRSAMSEAELEGLFGAGIETTESQIDAVWFERSRKDGGIAWEIRLLSERPFALCESFPEGFPQERIVEETKKMENRLSRMASQ